MRQPLCHSRSRALLCVAKDDERFARSNEAEVAAGGIFDGGGVGFQTPGLIAQLLVFEAELRDFRRERGVLFLSPKFCDVAVLADDRVHHQGRSADDERVAHQAASKLGRVVPVPHGTPGP